MTPLFLCLILAPSLAFAQKSTTYSVTIDGNFRKGQSDLGGDYKRTSQVRRDKGVVYAIDGALDTTPANTRAALRDTAYIKLTKGYETDKYGLYGSIGYTGNEVAGAAHAIVDTVHAATGMQASRKSPQSKAPKVFVSISGRRDWSYKNAHVVAYANIGNLETHAGAAAFVATPLGKTKGKFRPPIEGLPAPAIDGSYIYAGVNVKAVALDKRYEALHPKPLQLEIIGGVQYQRGSWGAGIQATHSLTGDAIGAKNKPVSKIMVRITKRF